MVDENDTNDDPDDSQGDGDGTSEPPKEKKLEFTQDRLNRIMGREKNDGRRAREQELLDEFGVNSVEDLKELLAEKEKPDPSDDFRKAVEKATDVARKATQRAEQAEAEAAQAKFDAKVNLALLTADVPAKSVNKIAKLLDLKPDADEDDIADAIDDLKVELPNLFSQQDSNADGEQDRDPRPRHSDPGRPPRQPNKPATSREQARSLLDERHPELADRRQS
jgi:hypothetical protein